jgi:hypothetical protein
LYSYNPSYLLQQRDEDFAKNISLYFKYSNEFIQINLVQKNGWTIEYIIKNGITPSEKVQIEAVNQDSYVITYIENPSEKVQLSAVNKNGLIIQHIINKGIVPSEKVQLTAVNQNGSVISLFENPSEKLQFAAVNNDAYSINYIKNPYPSVIELYEKLSGKKY